MQSQKQSYQLPAPVPEAEQAPPLGWAAGGQRKLLGAWLLTRQALATSGFVLVWFIVWRLLLAVVAGVGIWFNAQILPYGKLLSWNGVRLDHTDILDRALISNWAIWDSEYYKAIAQHGYTFRNVTWPRIAFFPLYPALIRAVLPLFGGNVVLASAVVANVAMAVALLLLHQLLLHDFGPKVARRSVVALLLFPTAIFFAASYTESLALALTVAVILALRHERWWAAGILGFFLALTRLPGVLTCVLIALLYAQRQQWRWRSFRSDILAALLPALGLGLFMLYQWWRFRQPFAFLIVQSQWDQHLSPPWVLPRILINKFMQQPLAIYVLHLAIWALFLVLAWQSWRRLPRLYSYVFLYALPAYLASWAFSIGRHVLVAFPAFIILALWAESRWARWLMLGIAVPLLIVCTVMFVNTFWIA